MEGRTDLSVESNKNKCDRGVREATTKPLRYSACSASGAVGSKRGKGGPDDTDHDPDQYTEKKSFVDRSRSVQRVFFLLRLRTLRAGQRQFQR